MTRLTEAEVVLRDQLRRAIRHRGEVQTKLAGAQQAFDRVRTLLSDLVQAEADAATFESLKTEIAAFRANDESPLVLHAALEVGKHETSAAQAALEEVRHHYALLDRELAAAQKEAIDAAKGVREAVEAIVRMEFDKIAMELVLAHQQAWRLLDLVNGYVRIDKRRPGGPTLREFQKRLCDQFNRRTAAIVSGHLEFQDERNWNMFLDERSAEAERYWTNYAAQLATDPFATLEQQSSQRPPS
jgi:hypothetical protein